METILIFLKCFINRNYHFNESLAKKFSRVFLEESTLNSQPPLPAFVP